jgi:hypothetical protein
MTKHFVILALTGLSLFLLFVLLFCDTLLFISINILSCPCHICACAWVCPHSHPSPFLMPLIPPSGPLWCARAADKSSHLEGKQHAGFALIRAKVEELQQKEAAARAAPAQRRCANILAAAFATIRSFLFRKSTLCLFTSMFVVVNPSPYFVRAMCLHPCLSW